MAEDKRFRNWTFIGYPESLDEDYIDKLNESNVKWAVSPLHDQDVWSKADERENPEHKEGTAKKPHYHFLVKYDGKKPLKDVEELTNSIKALKPQRVQSAEGLLRYFTHADDLEKHQYNVNDIYQHGMYDDVKRAYNSSEDKDNNINRIAKILDETKIDNAQVFRKYLAAEGQDDLINFMNAHFGVVRWYVDAQYQINQREKAKELEKHKYLKVASVEEDERLMEQVKANSEATETEKLKAELFDLREEIAELKEAMLDIRKKK